MAPKPLLGEPYEGRFEEEGLESTRLVYGELLSSQEEALVLRGEHITAADAVGVFLPIATSCTATSRATRSKA